MSAVEQLSRYPVAAVEFANIILTQGDATIGATPKDVVWTHRKTTLYRYRSTQRRHALPVLLVFALINRPDIFDLRPGLLRRVPARGGLRRLPDRLGRARRGGRRHGRRLLRLRRAGWGIRETLRASEQEELSLLGWCIGGTLVAMHAAIEERSPARNLVLLTTPVDTTGTLYANWVARDSFDADLVAEVLPAIPGAAIDRPTS